MGGFYSASHTVLVTGTRTGTTTVVQFRELPNSYTAPAGHCGVRVVNALMSGSYDVYFTTSGSPLTTPSIAGVTPTLFTPLVAGSWDVKVTLAGSQTVVADLGTVIVGGGNITVVIGPPQRAHLASVSS